MQIFKNWAVIILFLFVMFLFPLLISELHEIADTLRQIDSNKGLITRFLAWILKFFTGAVWTLSLLFVADHVPKLAGWGLNQSNRRSRSINIFIMTVLGYAITDVLTEIYKWLL